jgi:hypothetical protein
MSEKVIGTISFLVFAMLVTSVISVGAGKLYERKMTFVQHWLVSLIGWSCVFGPATASSIFHSEVMRLPAWFELVLTAATLVLAAFLMTHLARSWYGVSQGLGGKVVMTMAGLAAVIFAVRIYLAS